ncbi:E3 ubiquitin-protein ligase SH3RF1 isoform X3 [Pieris napi]|uniref:E3 ubiquitin-protein ligase SH3RF1 isoform X3 n=1 Tax=Pieris napi TaxID=78633 RepID=UPI001FBAB735|nr:E3 ubiquitin-protein ligase SH3RF1 isoform X3 [Pieris napi]
MDEGLLNDLLECSVCLERLDTSSRVLPCQHTFCLKCLKVIVESHKELRCPECRVLVEAKVEELPPNVLLMRILEGMKNSAPRKVSVQRVRTAHAQGQVQTQPSSRSDKQVPPHGRAMYDYISKEPGDLSFKKGETILLQKKLDPFWYHGECSGRSGVFPITYLQVIVPLAAAPALCKALYDFRMSAPDEEGCLAFDKGAIITVHRRVDENWAEGRLEQRVGIFPIAFVELNQAASHLMNSSPINRPVPPAPEHVRAGHSEHRHQAQHPHRYQQMSASTPASAQGNYQNVADATHATSQTATRPTQGSGPTSARRAASPRVAEPTRAKCLLDIVHFTNAHKGFGVQSVSRVDDTYDRFGAKLDNHSNGADVAYQNVRAERFPVAAFNSNLSSDSSSSANTPSSTTTPNTSSDTSTSESAEPSLPDSPDDDTERNPTVAAPEDDRERTRDASRDRTRPRDQKATAAPNSSECSTATNTSLNVSLPTESSFVEAREAEPTSLPCSSRITRSAGPEVRCSGPDSLLNFGLGLQAALSPSHGRDDYATRAPRDRHLREKRHSLTPTTHLQGGHNQNRHSAEILATSLLDHTPERDVRGERERERERRRRRSRSDERPLPAAYVALYPYRPQKPDEIELKKGGVYTVRERCRDGWYKGWCERLQRAGVFPGNYVAPLTPVANRIKHDKSAVISSGKTAPPASDGGNPSAPAAAPAAPAPPDAPPRADSPPAAAQTLSISAQPSTYPWSAPTQSQQGTPRADKVRSRVDFVGRTTSSRSMKPTDVKFQAKDRAKSEKSSISSGVSLMKRLAAMKKCKSPPPVGYSMDNPVFDDSPNASLVYAAQHSVHVRSGSCPSQLLRALPAGPTSAGQNPAPAGLTVARHKERPHDHRMLSRGSTEGLRQNQHRKSQSLDVTAARRDRHHSQQVKERFRCVVPYPPNSEYELELKVDDIVTVCKKRGDGWYKGTLQRTGRTGLFPASFVQSCPPE